jgi:hypothetical protein
VDKCQLEEADKSEMIIDRGTRERRINKNKTLEDEEG